MYKTTSGRDMLDKQMKIVTETPGGGGVLPGKFGRGVRPASQNPTYIHILYTYIYFI